MSSRVTRMGDTGAIGFADAAAIEGFLKRSAKTGTARTRGFEGPDAEKLTAAAKAMQTTAPAAENGIVGVTVTEASFAWREGAQRVFVNFTDEATQPSKKDPWTTKTLCAG